LRSKLWLKSSLLLASLCAAASAMSQTEIARARDLGYRQQYDSALAITSAAIRQAPSDPAGYYWQAAVLQLLINDSGRGGLADSFYALSDRTLSICRQRLAKDPDDTQAHLYFGLTQLNRSSFLGWQQRGTSAAKAMMDVTPHLDAALKRDPSLTEARLASGMIDFYKAASSKFTLGLQLMGSRPRAYAVIKPLADGDGPLKAAAQMMLVMMLKEDSRFDEAVTYCKRLLTVYPGNRSVMRMMRDAYFKAGRHSDAVRVGADLELAIPKAFPDNKYGMAENWDVCGKAYAQMGQKEEARKRFNRVIAWEPYQNDVPWLARYVSECKQFLKKL
jgi:tetratricopeptide (TPR) repeat protein